MTEIPGRVIALVAAKDEVGVPIAIGVDVLDVDDTAGRDGAVGRRVSRAGG
jgi:hypothetical protein